MKFHYFLISIILVSPLNGLKRYHPIYFDKYGILIEPSGVVVSYDKVKYVTFIQSFTGVNWEQGNTTCNSEIPYKLVKQVINHQLDMLYGSIPSSAHSIMSEYCGNHHALCLDLELQSNSTHRNKRMILATIAALTGIAGLAVSAYDWVKTNELTNHLGDVSKAIEEISVGMGNLDKGLYTVEKLQNDIIHKVSRSFEMIHAYINKYRCKHEAWMSSMDLQLSTVQTELELRALHNLINGDPDSYLIDNSVLDQILNSDSSLRNSIFKKDKSLFYQVARSNLIYTDASQHLFTFLLEIPVIETTMLSPLYKIYNGGWMNEGIYHKVDLPKAFYLYSTETERNFHAISLSDSSCWERNRITVCDNSKHMMTEGMICLNSILKKQEYDTCDLKLTRYMESQFVVKALSGVLVGGKIDVQVITSAGSQFNYITKKEQEKNYTRFYPYTDFNQLIIGSTLISSNRDKIPVVRRSDDLLHKLHLDLTFANSILTEKPWTSLKEIKIHKQNGWEYYPKSLSSHLNTVSFILWIFLGLLSTATIIYIFLLRRKLESLRKTVNDEKLLATLSRRR